MENVCENSKIRFALVYSGINSEYQGIITGAIVNKAKELNYDAAIFAPYSNTTSYAAHDYGEENIYSLINYDFFDAVIILAATMTSEENTLRVINEAKKSGTPIITIDGNYEGCNNIQISPSGVDELAEHLINVHNFTDFMFVGASSSEKNDKRLENIRNALYDFGLNCDESRILQVGPNGDNAAQVISEYINSAEMLPEAIICADDLIAIKVINELRRHGIYVPDDVVVTGFDGIKFAHSNNPSLTTVSLPYYECGEKAVEIIKEIISRPVKAVMNYEIKNKLTISESCGCFEKDLADDNNLISQLYSSLDKHTLYSKRLIKMSETLTSASTLNQAFEKTKEFIDDINVYGFYICIAPEFKSCIVRDELTFEKRFCHTGYPDSMIMKVCRENGEYFPETSFETRLMIPKMHEETEKSRIFFFAPVHFQDINFGYICLCCDDYVGSDALFNIWIMNLSVAIENSRIREELNEKSEKLEKLYVEDSLTGIYNRRGLYGWAAEIFSKSVDSGKEVMIFVADLDKLKPINDKYGHRQGDNALIQVANALKKASSSGEICSRFGGDEFGVVAYDYSEKKAKEFTENFCSILDEYNRTSGLPYKVSASCGYYVTAVTEKDDFDSLVYAADKEMYKNKSKKSV